MSECKNDQEEQFTSRKTSRSHVFNENKTGSLDLGQTRVADLKISHADLETGLADYDS